MKEVEAVNKLYPESMNQHVEPWQTDNRTITEIALKCIPTIKEAVEDDRSGHAQKILDQIASDMLARMPADLLANLGNMATLMQIDEHGRLTMMQERLWVSSEPVQTITFEGNEGWTVKSDQEDKARR